jgi:hypothetical protein
MKGDETLMSQLAGKRSARAAFENPLVTRGLDPRVHPLCVMDCRVKPGNDALRYTHGVAVFAPPG